MRIQVSLDDGPIDMGSIEENERNIGFKFSTAYKDFVRQRDGACLVNNILVVYDRCLAEEVQTIVCYFVSQDTEKSTNILSAYEIMVRECEQPDLVPFAEEGSGDAICFDYRGVNKASNDPPIVYWSSQFGEEDGKNPSPLAPNFLAFMEMLQPDPEHPADENAMEVEI